MPAVSSRRRSRLANSVSRVFLLLSVCATSGPLPAVRDISMGGGENFAVIYKFGYERSFGGDFMRRIMSESLFDSRITARGLDSPAYTLITLASTLGYFIRLCISQCAVSLPPRFPLCRQAGRNAENNRYHLPPPPPPSFPRLVHRTSRSRR